MKICLVIPTFNEKENIRPLTEAIFSLAIPDLEIIFVDDNSPDGTAGEIKSLAGRFHIRLIERPKKLGLGSAYVAGFQQALTDGANFIFEMDADFSHEPKDIPRLLAACQNGAGLAIGSRKIPDGKIIGWNWRRRLMSDGAMFFARLFLRLKTKDITAGFRCWRRETLEKIKLEKIKSDGYAFQEEILYRAERAGFSVIEVPVVFTDRAAGRSKLTGKDILEFFIVTLKIAVKKLFGSN